MHKFLVHQKGDHVGVATTDIESGEQVQGIFMDDDSSIEVVARQAIPLGHKIAIASLGAGTSVLKYGVRIGYTTSPWEIGEYVHTHNIKTARW